MHAVFFPQYDREEFTTVYHDGYYVSKHAESLMVGTTSPIGEEEVDLEFLRPEIEKCDEEQLARIMSLYNVHVTDRNILAYYPVNGFYALIRSEDYDPDIFDCGALPYSF